MLLSLYLYQGGVLVKKKIIYFVLIVATVILTSCGSSAQSKDTEKNNQVIKIGSEAADTDIWKFIAKSEAAEKAGIKLEVQDVEGGPTKNNAVAEGDLDANAFQTISYLESYNQDSKVKLAPIAVTYVEPMGVYSEKYKKISQVKNGAVIALADNPSQTARGLRVLEAAGLITLKDDFDDGTGTPDDIEKNSKNLKFKLIDDRTGPRVLQDVDLALISNTIALEGGLNVLQDSIYREKADKSNRANLNVIAVRADRVEEQELKKLGELYHDPEVQKYINDKFDGTKVEAEVSLDEVWQEDEE